MANSADIAADSRHATMNLVIVCVTYGNRAGLLEQVLGAARAQGAASAVVIDNGSHDRIAESLAARYSGWAHVHSLGANRGSALGFKTGMAVAVARGAELILLLDDDNLLAPLCLRTLQEHWCRHRQAGEPRDGFAVHAVRAGMHRHNTGALADAAEPRRGSFLGFHIADIPYKLMRRVAPALLRRAANQPEAADVSIAPYGGMLFHRDVIGRIGLPDEAFFLYVDDYEFAARLTAQNGKIHIVRDAVIYDIDTTWGSRTGAHRSALFTARLEIQNASKLYYATRNLLYFELHVRPPPAVLYALNSIVFMTVLTIMAIKKHRLPQYRTMLRAMRDGRRKCLGVNQAYQL